MFGKLINALRRNSSNEAVLCRRQVKNLKRQVKKHKLNFTKESGIISNRCCANTAKTAEISGENFDFSWEKPPFFYVVSTEPDVGMVSAFEMKNAVKVIDPIW